MFNSLATKAGNNKATKASPATGQSPTKLPPSHPSRMGSTSSNVRDADLMSESDIEFYHPSPNRSVIVVPGVGDYFSEVVSHTFRAKGNNQKPNSNDRSNPKSQKRATAFHPSQNLLDLMLKPSPEVAKNAKDIDTVTLAEEIGGSLESGTSSHAKKCCACTKTSLTFWCVFVMMIWLASLSFVGFAIFQWWKHFSLKNQIPKGVWVYGWILWCGAPLTAIFVALIFCMCVLRAAKSWGRDRDERISKELIGSSDGAA